MPVLRDSSHVLGAVMLATLALVCGCDEVGLRPLNPTDSAGSSRWEAVFPAEPPLLVNEVFALDADDVWIGGADGQLAHFDGQRVTRHQLPDQVGVRRIHGCRRDEVWALAGDGLYRWDGRQWSTAQDLEQSPEDHSTSQLWNDRPGELHVAGYDGRNGRPFVKRWDGRGWKISYLGDRRDELRALWSPAPDQPLMVLMQRFNSWWDWSSRLMAQTDGRWQEVPTAGDIWAIAGRLVVVDRPEDPMREALYRIGRDGSFEELCADFDIYQDRPVDGREPLLFGESNILALRGCVRDPLGVYENLRTSSLVTPRRSGSQGSCVYGESTDNQLARFTWQPDGTMTQELISLGSDILPDEQIVAAGEILYTIDRRDRLVVGSPSGWFIDHAPEFSVTELQALPDGSLLVETRSFGSDPTMVLGRRHPDGRWDWAPAMASPNLAGMWCDPLTGSFEVMLWNGDLLTCDGSAWRGRDSLGWTCLQYVAATASRCFAVLRDREGNYYIVGYDGETWHDMTPGGFRHLRIVTAGPHSGRLVVQALPEDIDERLTLIHDGNGWQEIPGDHYLYEGLETPAGEVFTRYSDRVYQLHAQGWKPVFDDDEDGFPGRSLQDFTIDADGYLVILDHHYQIFRRPLLGH